MSASTVPLISIAGAFLICPLKFAPLAITALLPVTISIVDLSFSEIGLQVDTLVYVY